MCKLVQHAKPSKKWSESYSGHDKYSNYSTTWRRTKAIQINCPGQLISLGLLLIGHQNVYSGMNWWLGLTVPGEIDVGLGEYILGH